MKNFSTFLSAMSIFCFSIYGVAGESSTLVLKKPEFQTISKAKKAGSGFFVASKDCKMYEHPSKSSNVIIEVQKGRKIWLDSFDLTWGKAKDRYGLSVFVKKSCFSS